MTHNWWSLTKKMSWWPRGTGDVWTFSFGKEEGESSNKKFNFINKGDGYTDSMEIMAEAIFLTLWKKKQKQLKKRGYSQWIKDETEKSAAMKFTAILLFCFFCWHSEQREQAAFFIGHMPLLNDLWTQGLFWLILLSTHYVAQPSMAIWGG